MSEKTFINGLKNIIPNNFIDDDCAVIPVYKYFTKDNRNPFGCADCGPYMLISTDTLNENVHFSLDYFSFEDIGYKSLAVNISDIAACGGIPLFLSVSITVPPYLKENQLLNIYDGFKILTNKFNLILTGGDTVKGDKLSITVTIIGKTEKPLMRKSANAGDYLYVTGALGASSYSLSLLLNKEKPIAKLLQKHLRPIPRINVINELSRDFYISSCIDISDGLSTDLYNLIPDNLGCEICFDSIPLADEMKELDKKSLFDFVLNGGEDFELLFTSPQKIEMDDVYNIGKITDSKNRNLIIGNETLHIQPKGWDHFK